MKISKILLSTGAALYLTGGFASAVTFVIDESALNSSSTQLTLESEGITLAITSPNFAGFVDSRGLDLLNSPSFSNNYTFLFSEAVQLRTFEISEVNFIDGNEIVRWSLPGGGTVEEQSLFAVGSEDFANQAILPGGVEISVSNLGRDSFDEVWMSSLTVTRVPEPSVSLFAGLGLVLLGARRRRALS